MSSASPDDLRDYLQRTRTAADGIDRFEAAGGRGWLHRAACTPGDLEALRFSSRRPPPGMEICKFGSRSVVGRYTAAGGTDLVLKYYYPRSPLKRITYGLRGSRAVQSWNCGLAFSFAGIPTAEPLALLEWRTAGLLHDKSFLAVRHLPGPSLETFVRNRGSDPAALEPVAEILRGLFARMARLRIAHGDLKATNIIVGDNGSVSFIDLDAAEVLVPDKRWPSSRARDIRLFQDNWRELPAAATAFARVFD